MLVSGDQDVIKRVEPELAAMTGKLINLGVTVGKAAAIKLIGNLFLISLTAGLSDTLALAKAEGLDGEDVSELLNLWNPAAMVSSRLKARKDAGLMMSAAKEGNAELTVVPAVARTMDKWIEKGHGNDDWTVIAKDSI
jgi:3-hydroxyisobutyrate dehydrogenase